ncbi:glycerol kinase GlpK [Paracoccaceae bacterium]|nr:glycerol kinase GlpK [Paracoccaceae bacterium]MDB3860085.1 glycerol kinase GlpK [Paracoccaceae bacterium]
MGYIIAIDQGTTSTRTIIFDSQFAIMGQGQEEFEQHFPKSGWVEHNPHDLLNTVITTCKKALTDGKIRSNEILALGITNQRETTLLWDKVTGEPIYNAIVWQDRRTSKFCDELRSAGLEKLVTSVTGLLLDPYFSATKLKWLMDNVEGARNKAEAGRLLFGTVDTYLIWHLTKGRVHATDATNASRTMLYDINKGEWSTEICELLNIPMSTLPEVRNCSDDFGVCDEKILGHKIPIKGVAGDQHAATIGQACFKPGMMKSTYGTGCFALLNTGESIVRSKNKLLTTIAYQFDGKPTYALEGSIFIAGAVVQWLRDGLKIINSAAETQDLAKNADIDQQVIIVPAFTGLGAPYWNADCRGAIYGLTRNSGPAELAKAALECVGFQTRDLLEAMQSDWQGDNQEKSVLRVDGGMTSSDWAMQFLSDIINVCVDRPKTLETTALGAAWLAGSAVGFYPSFDEFSRLWKSESHFVPMMQEDEREKKYSAWKTAVKATISA